MMLYAATAAKAVFFLLVFVRHPADISGVSGIQYRRNKERSTDEDTLLTAKWLFRKKRLLILQKGV